MRSTITRPLCATPRGAAGGADRRPMFGRFPYRRLPVCRRPSRVALGACARKSISGPSVTSPASTQTSPRALIAPTIAIKTSYESGYATVCACHVQPGAISAGGEASGAIRPGAITCLHVGQPGTQEQRERTNIAELIVVLVLTI